MAPTGLEVTMVARNVVGVSEIRMLALRPSPIQTVSNLTNERCRSICCNEHCVW